MDTGKRSAACWFAVGAALVGYCVTLAFLSPQFGPTVVVRDMPVPVMVGLSCLAGVVYIVVVPLSTRHASPSHSTPLLVWIVIVGAAMRLVFLGSEPILEDDSQRYLWDGALLAHGFDPYAHAPALVSVPGLVPDGVLRLAEEAIVLVARINHPELRTVYPPVAQAAFALAHWMEPWSLDAWRLVVFAAEIAVAVLVVTLLRDLARPLPLFAIYWWNPVIVKELSNSAHMDALVMMCVAGAAVLAVRRRAVFSALVVAIGYGTKLWPLILLPSVLRSRHVTLPIAILASILAMVLCAALTWPIVRATLDVGSGFIAYGGGWQANDVLFRLIAWFADIVASVLGLDEDAGGLLARATVAGLVIGLVLWLNRTPAATPLETCRRMLLSIAALLFLSPTQFPWYFCWIAPLLPLFPVPGFLVLTVTLPLYYLYFHLSARDLEAWFHDGLVFAIWLPALALLAHDAIRGKGTGEPDAGAVDTEKVQ